MICKKREISRAVYARGVCNFILVLWFLYAVRQDLNVYAYMYTPLHNKGTDVFDDGTLINYIKSSLIF
jgi:hypothetical protein